MCSSYLQLHDALVVLGGEFGVLEQRVLHVDQVPLLGGEAVQDEGHLGDHGRLQRQLGQRGRGALDGGAVLSIHAALHRDTARGVRKPSSGKKDADF